MDVIIIIMAINKKGGKKHKKRAKYQPKITMVFKEDSNERYVKVTKMLGSGNLEAKLPDNTIQFCSIPGSMRKKKWIKLDDILLVAIREYQPSKADILFVYSASQVEILKKDNLIPKSFLQENDEEEYESNVVFGDENSDEDSQNKISQVKSIHYNLEDDHTEGDEINLEDI